MKVGPNQPLWQEIKISSDIRRSRLSKIKSSPKCKTQICHGLTRSSQGIGPSLTKTWLCELYLSTKHNWAQSHPDQQRNRGKSQPRCPPPLFCGLTRSVRERRIEVIIPKIGMTMRAERKSIYSRYRIKWRSGGKARFNCIPWSTNLLCQNSCLKKGFPGEQLTHHWCQSSSRYLHIPHSSWWSHDDGVAQHEWGDQSFQV